VKSAEKKKGSVKKTKKVVKSQKASFKRHNKPAKKETPETPAASSEEEAPLFHSKGQCRRQSNQAPLYTTMLFPMRMVPTSTSRLISACASGAQV
jgi:hypothetical protein